MSDALLQAQRVSKRFEGPNGAIEVLSDADLHVTSGESVSIRGESGAGKTTLLNLLAGLEAPSAGEILWRGTPIARQRPRELARQRCGFLGMVFQTYYLLPELNALDNVLLPARMAGRIDGASRRRARDLLEAVGLAERLRQLPAKLSGGERQRVAIARALINRPPLLLADEPTGNLDEHTGAEVMRIFLELVRGEGVGLLMVTHNPEFARRTARQLLLRNGALLSAAAPATPERPEA